MTDGGSRTARKGKRAVLRKQNRVTVFSGLDDGIGADRAPGARTIDRQHRRLQQPRDLFAQGARGNVRSVTRGKRNHEISRAGGERLGVGGGRQPDERAGEKDALGERFHELPTETLSFLPISSLTASGNVGAVCRDGDALAHCDPLMRPRKAANRVVKRKRADREIGPF